MAKKPKRKSRNEHENPTAHTQGDTTIEDAILVMHVMEQFGVGRKWIKARIQSGQIRSQKIGKHLVLERSDVERLAPPLDLVRQAIKNHEQWKQDSR